MIHHVDNVLEELYTSFKSILKVFLSFLKAANHFLSCWNGITSGDYLSYLSDPYLSNRLSSFDDFRD
jgi:hypothetical protein